MSFSRFDQYPDIMTTEEAADALRIGKSYCYKLLATGRLKSFKLGKKVYKIPKSSIEEYVDSQGYTIWSNSQ